MAKFERTGVYASNNTCKVAKHREIVNTTEKVLKSAGFSGKIHMATGQFVVFIENKSHKHKNSFYATKGTWNIDHGNGTYSAGEGLKSFIQACKIDVKNRAKPVPTKPPLTTQASNPIKPLWSRIANYWRSKKGGN